MEETKVQETTEGGQEPQNQQQTAAAGAQPGQEPAAEQFDAEYVRKLRAEAAEYRKRLRELEREQAAYQRERQERTLKYETMLAASRLGIVDPEVAYKLLDLAGIEFDEDGTPRNIEAALKELLKAKPYLAAQPAASSGSPTNPARTGAGASDAFTAALYRGAGLKKE